LRTDDGRVRARYWLETGDDPQRAAAVIAGEQSSGTFTAVPGETAALKERSGARVDRIEVIGHASEPSLPVNVRSDRYTQCILELSWPVANFGHSLPNLMATIAGNLFELRQVSGLRILDLAVPQAFAGFRHRGHARAGTGAKRAADRHHHQAQRGSVAQGDGRHRA